MVSKLPHYPDIGKRLICLSGRIKFPDVCAICYGSALSLPYRYGLSHDICFICQLTFSLQKNQNYENIRAMERRKQRAWVPFKEKP